MLVPHLHFTCENVIFMILSIIRAAYGGLLIPFVLNK